MTAQLHLLAGLTLIHVVWALCYATGTLLDAAQPPLERRSHALAEFVIRSATGLALWGFGGFVLGTLHALTPWGLALLLVLFAAASRAANAATFSAAFWRDRLARVGKAFGRAELCLYYIALLTIVPAVLPDIESDSVRYHLAYAADWAVHADLYIDRFLRQPFYANNFLLVFAEFDVFRLQAYVHFATWLCGALAVLGVRAALAQIGDAMPAATSRLTRLSREAVTFLLPLTIVIPAVFLRWIDTGMVDIPMELYVFVPALCAVSAFAARRDFRWSAVCCGAFFIGMKVSLIAFAPLVAATVWLLVVTLGGTRKAAALATIVLLLAASPWYVRNVIFDHDPVPPLLNLALHHPDLTYNADDAAGTLADIKPDRTIGGLVALPFRMWADPLGHQFREYGTVALNVLLYAPLLGLAAGIAFGAKTPRTKLLLLLCATSAYGLAYCVGTSYLMRYLLVTQTSLAAAVGALLLWLPAFRYADIGRVAVAAFAVLPSPGSWGFYNTLWQTDYRYLEARYPSSAAFLERDLLGYPQTERVLASPPFAKRPSPHVLLIQADAEYYFRIAGVETVGDWFGPGRYDDLKTALDNDRLPDYLRKFDVGAVILNRKKRILDPIQFEALASGLRKLGFRTAENNPDGFYVAIRDAGALPAATAR